MLACATSWTSWCTPMRRTRFRIAAFRATCCGNVTLGLMNEQLGRSPIAPRVFGSAAPDTGNMEILWLAGSPEQKRTFLEPLAADELRSCIAMTEPEVSGSDPTQIRTTAVLENGQFVGLF